MSVRDTGQIFWWWIWIQTTAIEIRGMNEDRVLSSSSNDAARWFCKKLHDQDIYSHTGTDGLLTIIWITIFHCTKANENSFNACYKKIYLSGFLLKVKGFVNLPWADTSPLAFSSTDWLIPNALSKLFLMLYMQDLERQVLLKLPGNSKLFYHFSRHTEDFF